MYTEEMYLPTVEELTVPEVNLSTNTLRAASFHLGKYCESKNNEFMLCRDELKDPRKCLKEGREVTSCSLDFFRQMKKNCAEEFNTYSTCMWKTSGDYAFKHCRKTQSVYDQCMLEKMDIPRPEYGYFCRVRVHDTDRPKPPKPKKEVYVDATPALPDDKERIRAKYGSRLHWITE
ncbi:NADH dehydrogenase [ubiquinone] 1 alpha subcomplex subunit 8 [Arctopsyche grandis]|uniref:NADH dehydrogenase [ubiquinone] 1 alpha subcomplex subunit 8 n=1 Tax=Arctopsyche grandis TaxID=121162 RepID=UPI00406D759F